jgi:hypothetical protein
MELLSDPRRERSRGAMQPMLEMRKSEVAEVERAAAQA